MQVKLKDIENIHEVIGWGTEELPIPEKDHSLFSKKTKLCSVVLVKLRNEKGVKAFPITDIEQLEK